MTERERELDAKRITLTEFDDDPELLEITDAYDWVIAEDFIEPYARRAKVIAIDSPWLSPRKADG